MAFMHCLLEIALCVGNNVALLVVFHHRLEALDPNAYEAFQASRDLMDVVSRVQANREASNGVPGMAKKLSIRASLMTPVLPMLVSLNP